MQNEITVYIPEIKEFLYVCEGTGDNLLEEDYDEGYVDYVYIETYSYGFRELKEEDGGQIMFTELFSEKYTDIKDVLNDAMEFMYGKTFDYTEIERK